MARGRGDRSGVPSTAGADLYLDSRGRLKPVEDAGDFEAGTHARRTGLEVALRISGLGVEGYTSAIKDMSKRLGIRALLPDAAGVVIVDASRTSPVLDRIAKNLKDDDFYSYSWGEKPVRAKTDREYRNRAADSMRSGVISAWERRPAFHVGGRHTSVELPVLGEPNLRTVPIDRSGSKGTAIQVEVDFSSVEGRLLRVGVHCFGAEAYNEELPQTRALTLATIGLKYADAKELLLQEGLMSPEVVVVGPPEFTPRDLQ